MTRAPKTLLDVRRLLLTHLQPHGLAPAAVGVVGDPAHRGGYHCGSDRVVSGDYSVTESTRDRAGLSDYASALDVGSFTVRSAGRTHDLRSFSLWCVGQADGGAPDTLDIREIIYSPDGRTVRRWDRLGRRTTGDNSHLWHTHFSFFRDSTKAGRDQTPLFRRYLTTIGLIQEADDVTPDDIEKVAARTKALILSDGGIQQLLTRVAKLPTLISAESTSPSELSAAMAGMLTELGGRSPAAVAQALVAAGQDPAGLAAELTRIAAGSGQARG